MAERERLHRIAEAMGVMNYHDEPTHMEREIMKALCQPLFLAVIRDRHSDDAYALFRDPEKGKAWIRDQLEELLSYVSWEAEIKDGIRGVDFFAPEEEWVACFFTYEDGPRAKLVVIPAPSVQEGGG